MDAAEISKVINDYDGLVERAVTIANGHPFFKYIDAGDVNDLMIDDDRLVITWKEYESDYYGGGNLSEDTYAIPLSLVSLSDAEITEMQTKAGREADERAAKVRAAEQAVARERQEIQERHMLTLLKAKYEPSA